MLFSIDFNTVDLSTLAEYVQQHPEIAEEFDGIADILDLVFGQ